MELHKLLLRQLKHLELNSEVIPLNFEKWQEFLQRISITYEEADQERYLNERSVDISSRELLELNEKLEESQHIAHLGYWAHDITTGKITASKELLHLFGIDLKGSFEQFIQQVHKKDRESLIKAIDKAISDGIRYEKEIRIQHADGKYHWYYVIGGFSKSTNQMSGIAMEITRRKQAEQEVASLNQKLLVAAHEAGMADIAASILHNVGNILNSANVSLGILQEIAQEPQIKKVISAIELLKEHQDKIDEYLTKDRKGQLIPQYFVAILEDLKTEGALFAREIATLTTCLQHIHEIIAMQRTFSSVLGVTEKVFLPEIIDIALKMSGYASSVNGIQINKIYKSTPFVIIDKSKLLQILINIIKNAKEALIESDKEVKKTITISVDKGRTDEEVVLKISDNGVGIAPENLIKVFLFGFTTKPNGHGIGLNSCSIVAKELGGNLIAESKGVGQGATFILRIPINQNDEQDV